MRRVRRTIFAALAASLILVAAPFLAKQAAADGPAPDDSLAPIETLFHDQLNDLLVGLDSLAIAYPNVYAGAEVADRRVSVWVVRESADSEAFYEALETLASEASEVDVVTLEADLSDAEVKQAMQDIHEFGIPGVAMAVEWTSYDPARREVTVITSDRSDDGSAESSAEIMSRSGLRVGVRVVHDGSEVRTESGNSGGTPWFGASTLHGGGSRCTAGFTWKKWGSGELMGSTAEHCFEGTGTTGVTSTSTVTLPGRTMAESSGRDTTVTPMSIPS